MEGLGDAYFASDNFSQAASVFERLASLQSDAAKLRALRKAIVAVFELGDASHLMDLVKKVEPYAAADRLESARILMHRGHFFHLRSKFFDTTGSMEAALRVFEEEYSLPDVASALLTLGGYHSWFGMLEEGLAESLRCIVMFEEIGDLRLQMDTYLVGGMSFMNSTLYREALQMLAKVIEFGEKKKIGGYSLLASACITSAHCLSFTGTLKEAMAFDLKALEFSKKTDAALTQAMVYSELTVQYALLGDLKHAEEYYEKLMRFPKEIINHQLVGGQFAMAFFFACKNRWEESYRAFEEILEMLKDVRNPFSRVAMKTKYYTWALERQGRIEEAKIQREEMERTNREAEERFAHANVQANLMARSQVVVGEEFEMRLDLVNVSRKPALFVEVKNLLPDDFEVLSLPTWCSIQDRSIEMNNKELSPFHVNTTKLTLKCLKTGTFTLNPQAVYVDDLGGTKTCNLRSVTITANLPAPKEKTAGKIPSGTPDLDHILLGGLPENYSIVLSAPSSDERLLLIKRFFEAGSEAGETTFYITADAANTKIPADKTPIKLLRVTLQPPSRHHDPECA